MLAVPIKGGAKLQWTGGTCGAAASCFAAAHPTELSSTAQFHNSDSARFKKDVIESKKQNSIVAKPGAGEIQPLLHYVYTGNNDWSPT
jgi:hypothetical protein